AARYAGQRRGRHPRADEEAGDPVRSGNREESTGAQRQVARGGAARMTTGHSVQATGHSVTADAFEYAIKKDVRNNPIVREVDRNRQRELWRSVGVGGLLVAVLLFSAWQHFELLRHGYRLEQMQKERMAEEEINRHLKLEIETLRS